MDIKTIEISVAHTEQNSKLIAQLSIKGAQLNLGVVVKIKGNKQDPDITRMRSFSEKVRKEFSITAKPQSRFTDDKKYWSTQLKGEIGKHLSPCEILEKIEQLQP